MKLRYFPLSLLSLFIGLTTLQAQPNVVKGRLFALPIANIYSVGLGYERMVTPTQSVQLLFNRYGYDFSATDGEKVTTHALVPEYRFYYGKHVDANMNKAAFFGLFSELSIMKELPSGESFTAGARNLRQTTRHVVAPGLLFGKNFRAGARHFLGVYLGAKLRFVREQASFSENQVNTTETEAFSRLGLRIGVNFGGRF